MSMRFLLSRVFACVFLSMCAVSTLVTEVKAAQVTIDSLTYYHNTSNHQDSVTLIGTWTFSTSGYYGSWAIDEINSGDTLGYGNGLASGQHQVTVFRSHPVGSGSVKFSGYVSVYYMVGSGQVTVVNDYENTGIHSN